jgi:uncharacterized protein YuzE
MRFHYDKKIDALYLRFNESRYRESDEVADGIILDYDRSGRLVGLEVLDASKKLSKDMQNAFRKKNLPAVFDIVRQSPEAVAN